MSLSKRTREIIEREVKCGMQTYTRQPLVLARGKGALVWDIEGREYIDCFAGLAVCSTGHCHDLVVEAIKAQVQRLMHVSNIYYTEEQVKLAEVLVELARLDRVFFANSGAEANEAALKLARKATGKKEIIACEGSFHGRTMGALSVTHKERYRKPFEPLIPGVKFVKYNSPEAISQAITQDTAAVILEPVQGEGGVVVPDKDYLKQVREICDEKKILLILDEVQTGFARTGKWFAYEYYDIQPDILTLAKALGSGFPIGAMLAREEIAARFEKGDHASTFGGNPLACTAALATIQAIKRDKLVEKAREKGEYFMNLLVEKCRSNLIREVRGLGLMIGMELSVEGKGIVDRARERGVLINCTSEKVLRFLPPLVITKRQLARVVDITSEEIEKEASP
ncbi:MAG: acetylornithine transaminase [Methanocellales archaeon]